MTAFHLVTTTSLRRTNDLTCKRLNNGMEFSQYPNHLIHYSPRSQGIAANLLYSATNDDSDWLVDDEDQNDDDRDWIPDRVKAQQKREQGRIYAEKLQDRVARSTAPTAPPPPPQPSDGRTSSSTSSSAYTDEEEDVIAAMGGKTFHPNRRREQGFLGDSTLQEICTDYSVPICYLADVLTMWGVPVPIHVNDRLGDLVTGEQAFSILEAVNSLDVAALHDRYSNASLQQICAEWDIPLQSAFEMALKEGWSLPFGVQTNLRVEQEEELLRVLGTLGSGGTNEDEEEYDDDD